jgi:hypothetical protein
MVRICNQPHLVVLLALDFISISKSCLVSFGCPMAAILGLQQRLFSKFRITTNGGQCILAEIVLPIAKWELMYVVMLKRRKHRAFFLRWLRYLCSSMSSWCTCWEWYTSRAHQFKWVLLSDLMDLLNNK